MEETIFPRYAEDLKTRWTEIPALAWKFKSIPMGVRQFLRDREMLSIEKSRFLFAESYRFYGNYKPRIAQAAVTRISEIDRESNPDRFVYPEVLGEALNAYLRFLFEMQGRWGDAVDQCWYAYLDQFSQEKFVRFVELQVLGSYSLRDVDILKYADRVYSEHSDDLWLGRYAGVRLWRAGKFAEAEPLLAQAAERFSDDPEGRFAWAESRMALGMPIDPDQIMGPPCRPSIHFETQEAMRVTYRGQLHAKRGDFVKALSDAASAVKLDPRLHRAWALLVELSRKSGDLHQATESESQARSWQEKENQLADATRLYAKQIRQPMTLSPNEASSYRNAYVDALRAADWPRAADALALADRFVSSEKYIRTLRNLPEFHPANPDRFFQARPILRAVYANSISDREAAR